MGGGGHEPLTLEAGSQLTVTLRQRAWSSPVSGKACGVPTTLACSIPSGQQRKLQGVRIAGPDRLPPLAPNVTPWR